MQVSAKAIAEFQELHRKYFGQDIAADAAELEAVALLELVAQIQSAGNDAAAIE